MIRLLKAVFSVLLVSSAAIAGDLTITMNAHGKGPMGSGSNSVQTHYYSSKFMRMNDPANQVDTLMDYGTMTSYTINHKKKLIQKMSFQDAVDAMNEASSQNQEGMSAMMNAMFGDPDNFKVTEEGKDSVAGRSCNKYKILVGKLVMELSNDPTLKMPMPEVSYQKMVKMRGAMMAAMPSGKAFVRLYEEMSKIKGLTLKSHMTGMMGMDIQSEATAVKEGAIDPSVFALPSGYQMEDMGAKLKAQMAKQHH
ncbi:MAG TPA: hypothetical protein VFF76_11225 [Holophagaceae bacterium]|jgi:hypothetical protein|nr:hypothetical protein [Holophagaceae bacterium]